jgi:hypothetical protein
MESSGLEASGRAVARYWGTPPDAVRRAAEAGLLPVVGVGFDAERSLELGARPFVTPQDLSSFATKSILMLQQSPVVWLDSDDEDLGWRTAYGWSAELTAEQALQSACGWWPVALAQRSGVRALVSAVSSFVVTVALVDASDPVRRERHGKVCFNVSPATRRTSLGRAVLDTFTDHRVKVRQGSSFLIP